MGAKKDKGMIVVRNGLQFFLVWSVIDLAKIQNQARAKDCRE